MRTIIEGKDAVLNFLENESLKHTNEKQSVYQLVRDDGNNLVLFIEGFTFIGSGSVSIGGNLLNVDDGRVVKTFKNLRSTNNWLSHRNISSLILSSYAENTTRIWRE